MKCKRRCKRVRDSWLVCATPVRRSTDVRSADIDFTFKATVLRAVEPFDEVEEREEPTMDDRNKTFRTRFICVWLLMNALLGTLCDDRDPL